MKTKTPTAHQQKRVLRMQVLNDLPFADAAQQLLERACLDVNSMMCRHLLLCGHLQEFYPSPDSPLLRGLNRDMGHIIFIRLRKHGAVAEFLAYDVILNTLVHELAHNIVTEHSTRFWQLYLVLRREVAVDMGEDLQEREGEGGDARGYTAEELRAEEADHGNNSKGGGGSSGRTMGTHVPPPTYECVIMPPPPPPLFAPGQRQQQPQQRKKCSIS